eukprot:gene17580-23906_t
MGRISLDALTFYCAAITMVVLLYLGGLQCFGRMRPGGPQGSGATAGGRYLAYAAINGPVDRSERCNTVGFGHSNRDGMGVGGREVVPLFGRKGGKWVRQQGFTRQYRQFGRSPPLTLSHRFTGLVPTLALALCRLVGSASLVRVVTDCAASNSEPFQAIEDRSYARAFIKLVQGPGPPPAQAPRGAGGALDEDMDVYASAASLCIVSVGPRTGGHAQGPADVFTVEESDYIHNLVHHKPKEEANAFHSLQHPMQQAVHPIQQAVHPIQQAMHPAQLLAQGIMSMPHVQGSKSAQQPPTITATAGRAAGAGESAEVKRPSSLSAGPMMAGLNKLRQASRPPTEGEKTREGSPQAQVQAKPAPAAAHPTASHLAPAAQGQQHSTLQWGAKPSNPTAAQPGPPTAKHAFTSHTVPLQQHSTTMQGGAKPSPSHPIASLKAHTMSMPAATGPTLQRGGAAPKATAMFMSPQGMKPTAGDSLPKSAGMNRHHPGPSSEAAPMPAFTAAGIAQRTAGYMDSPSVPQGMKPAAGAALPKGRMASPSDPRYQEPTGTAFAAPPTVAVMSAFTAAGIAQRTAGYMDSPSLPKARSTGGAHYNPPQQNSLDSPTVPKAKSTGGGHCRAFPGVTQGFVPHLHPHSGVAHATSAGGGGGYYMDAPAATGALGDSQQGYAGSSSVAQASGAGGGLYMDAAATPAGVQQGFVGSPAYPMAVAPFTSNLAIASTMALSNCHKPQNHVAGIQQQQPQPQQPQAQPQQRNPSYSRRCTADSSPPTSSGAHEGGPSPAASTQVIERVAKSGQARQNNAPGQGGGVTAVGCPGRAGGGAGTAAPGQGDGMATMGCPGAAGAGAGTATLGQGGGLSAVGYPGGAGAGGAGAGAVPSSLVPSPVSTSPTSFQAWGGLSPEGPGSPSTPKANRSGVPGPSAAGAYPGTTSEVPGGPSPTSQSPFANLGAFVSPTRSSGPGQGGPHVCDSPQPMHPPRPQPASMAAASTSAAAPLASTSPQRWSGGGGARKMGASSQQAWRGSMQAGMGYSSAANSLSYADPSGEYQGSLTDCGIQSLDLDGYRVTVPLAAAQGMARYTSSASSIQYNPSPVKRAGDSQDVGGA